MTIENNNPLNPVAMQMFIAGLSNLGANEMEKAKVLYIKNAISDYRLARKSQKVMLIVMGLMSIIPIFLVVFIPALLASRAANKNIKEKIKNAIEIWEIDCNKWNINVDEI